MLSNSLFLTKPQFIFITVESRFKKARFKKESRFKKDCGYNQFFSTKVVRFKKDFLRHNVQFKKDFFPKSGKNRDFWQF